MLVCAGNVACRPKMASLVAGCTLSLQALRDAGNKQSHILTLMRDLRDSEAQKVKYENKMKAMGE